MRKNQSTRSLQRLAPGRAWPRVAAGLALGAASARGGVARWSVTLAVACAALVGPQLAAAAAVRADSGPSPQVSVGIRWHLSDDLMESLNEPAAGRAAAMSAECVDGGVRRELAIRSTPARVTGAVAPLAAETLFLTELPEGRVVTSHARPPALQRAVAGAPGADGRDRRGELAALYPQVFTFDCAALRGGLGRGLADSVRAVLGIAVTAGPDAEAAVPLSVDLRAYGLGRATLQAQREGQQWRVVARWVDTSTQSPLHKLARLQQASDRIAALLARQGEPQRFVTQHRDGELSEGMSFLLSQALASVGWSFGPQAASLIVEWRPAGAGRGEPATSGAAAGQVRLADEGISLADENGR